MPREDGLPPGTLIMLVLRVLAAGPLHGYAIAQRIHTLSREELSVEEGSLYPALQKLLLKGWVKAAPAVSETGRAVREYRLTPAGKKQLDLERANYRRVTPPSMRCSTPHEVVCPRGRPVCRREHSCGVDCRRMADDTHRRVVPAIAYLLNRGRVEAALKEEMNAHRAMMGEPARFGNTLQCGNARAMCGDGTGSTAWCAICGSRRGACGARPSSRSSSSCRWRSASR